MTKSFFFRSFFLLLIASTLLGGWFAYFSWTNSRSTELIFLDVGQGDAILIRQGSNQILIDGGRSGRTLLSSISKYMPFWDRNLEVVIATHPDADHIGGLPSVFRSYRVDTFVSTGAESSSDIYRYFKQAREEHPPTRSMVAKRGLSFTFPQGGSLVVWYPEDGNLASGDTNESSIVTRFSFGETDIALLGDLPHEERFLPSFPQSEILKLAHHGSKSSSSKIFLERVGAQEAVISVGKNSYGHPAQEVLDRTARISPTIRRTDMMGDIVYACVATQNRCAFAP